jgi:hypothetical protein
MTAADRIGSSIGGIGQLPVGASSSLFSSLLQSLEQTVGASPTLPAQTAPSSAGTSSAAAGSTVNLATAGPGAGAAASSTLSGSSEPSSVALQNFLNSLLQTLQRDGAHFVNAGGTDMNAKG